MGGRRDQDRADALEDTAGDQGHLLVLSGPPVAVGPVAVFAQDGIVHGIRLADGHPLWSWPGGQSVYGMWRRGGLVAVLTDQVSNHARLTGLDAVTGAVRWSLRLPARGLLGGQALTADGGLAMAVAGQGLQVVNLADGRVRWQLRIPASPALPPSPAW